MSHKETEILIFLLTNEFNEERGYSYSDLIKFLKTYQYHYKELYDIKETYRRELTGKISNSQNCLDIIKQLEEKILLKEKETNVLYTKIHKKLSLWERITGKIKI